MNVGGGPGPRSAAVRGMALLLLRGGGVRDLAFGRFAAAAPAEVAETAAQRGDVGDRELPVRAVDAFRRGIDAKSTLADVGTALRDRVADAATELLECLRLSHS